MLLPKYNLISPYPVNYVCVLSVLNIHHSTDNMYSFPWRRPHLPLPVFSVVYNSLWWWFFSSSTASIEPPGTKNDSQLVSLTNFNIVKGWIQMIDRNNAEQLKVYSFNCLNVNQDVDRRKKIPSKERTKRSLVSYQKENTSMYNLWMRATSDFSIPENL